MMAYQPQTGVKIGATHRLKKPWIEKIMNRIFVCTVLLASLVIVPTAMAETLVFAPLPMQNRETLIKQFRPMTDYLEKELDIKIEYSYSEGYDEIIKKFSKMEIDLAYLGPLPFVELRTRFEGAEPLVHFKETNGDAFYTCAVVTFPEADFDIEHAMERKVALTQPLSTCGYLSTNRLFRNHGSNLKDNYFRYLNKHDAVALAVVRGEFEAGGLKTAIAKKYAHLGLRILDETPPLPAFALVGNRRKLSPKHIARITEVLCALEPNGPHADLLASWGNNIRNGAVPASNSDYDVVRLMLKDTFIPQDNNF